METQFQENAILSVRNVSKNFGGVQALVDASFELYPSEILAIVGANGAGKTTLMKIIIGVYKPDSGSVFIEGNPVTSFEVSSIRNQGIEMVYQNLALVKNMDSPYNLFVGKIPKKWGLFVDRKTMEKKTFEVYQKLGISTVQDIRVPIENFSGGQQQALAIGRAIAWGRKVIILDEPTAALGVTETEQVLNLISDLKKQGSSIILISHNMDHVFRLADRILVIRNGKSVAQIHKSETSINELVKVITSGGI